jgi:hypothetical protein
MFKVKLQKFVCVCQKINESMLNVITLKHKDAKVNTKKKACKYFKVFVLSGFVYFCLT